MRSTGTRGDINPAAAASAADRVAKFISSSKEVLGTQVYEELGGDNNWVIVQSGAPSDIAQTEQGGGGDWRAYTIPSDFADAEREEGDAWRNHIAIGGQIEEYLSHIVDLFSKAYHDASNVSVLFTYSRYYKFVFLTCFIPPFPCLQQLLSMSRDKNDRMARLHSRVHWLDSYNGTLVARLEEANARADQVTPLEARIRELEQELARATGERDA